MPGRTAATLLGAVIAAAPAAACPPPGAPATAAEVRADGTVRLADGRSITLAGVALAEGGAAVLGVLAEGREITVRPLGRPDRWGRQAAHVDGVEEELLLRGLGHAAAFADGTCLQPLLAAEARARTRRTGVWAREGYTLAATDGAALTESLGRHVLVEGRVASARQARGRVYLNFARYWKSGLSLIIAEKDWPLFARGAKPEGLVGRKLRARGRLEYRSGPAIVAGPGDRIEILE